MTEELLYLNKRHAEADSQDNADVGDDPALHTGGASLMKMAADLNTEKLHHTRKMTR